MVGWTAGAALPALGLVGGEVYQPFGGLVGVAGTFAFPDPHAHIMQGFGMLQRICGNLN